MSRASSVLLSLGLAAAAIGLSAQNAPQTSNIRVATRLVRVGVIVRDKNGAVANLTKDDFRIFDRGKRRDISVFTAEAAAAVADSAEHAQSMAPNTFSDLPRYQADPPRSVTIVLLDNLNSLYHSAPQDQYEVTPSWIEDLALYRAKTHLIEFIKTLGPQDRVAIYGLRDSLRILCDFTSNRAQLLAIVSKYDTTPKTNRAVAEPGYRVAPLPDNAADPFENEAAAARAAMANGDRAAMTMAALAAIADHVANIPGRKNLVWLTGNLPFSGAAMARVLSPANIAVYPVDSRGLLAHQHSLQIDMMNMGATDADSVSGASGRYDNAPAASSIPIGITAMQELAEQTGGQAFVNTNDITGAIRKAVEDSAVTYTLGFYIDRASIDGKFHEIKVEVERKGVTVRYPKGYFAFEDVPVTKDQTRENLVTALRSPIESSAIPVAARVERVEKPLPHCLSIFGSIDIHDVRLVEDNGERTGRVDVLTIEQDESGKIIAQSGSTIGFRLPDQKYAGYLKTGFPFHQYVQPRTGTATLRILVEDPSTAQVGSLIIPLSNVK
jgi:VWFA-related protein